MFSKKKIIQIIGSVAIGFLSVACADNKAKEAEINEDIVSVQVANVTQETINEKVITSGLLSSSTEARLSFKIGGIIEKIYVKEGQSVTNGQLLATLNQTEINAQVTQAAEGLGKAERDLGRISNLYKDSVATLEQYQNVNTAYTVAKQNVDIAKFNQNYAEIRAIANGKILKKLMNVGELAQAGAPLFLMNGSASQDWVIKVGLADRDWAKINIGDKANVYFDAYPDENFEGIVTQLSQAADPMSGTFQVEISVNPQNTRFASGLMASVEIAPSNTKAKTTIPIEALVESNGKTGIVYTIDENKIARKINIKISRLAEGKVIVLSGLENVNQVVTAGSPYLVEGKKVIVK
ncbi:MAG: efflux RND transporter periplasmic adaptor subunit [Cytophagales bacterium]|nr:MAG: efflux RND transporter periplasmic adaptor subunit [Cytophagales bacterium]